MTQRLRIAVADDEADMRDFFERMLPLCGYEVVALAETGKELVEHCRTLKPDLVITDIKMPDMDGIQASSLIAEEMSILFILVSAYHDASLIQRADANHVLAYLVKPIGQADLAPAIAVAMRRFQELQSLRKEASDLKQSLADRKVIEQAKRYSNESDRCG
jgi:response regulator NasT